MTGAASADRLADVAAMLDAAGLLVRGAAALALDDPIAATPECGHLRSVVLIGHAGSTFWQSFATSPEFADGASDPLDRWSRRIAEQAAAILGGVVVMPSDGPPYAPFQHWAMASEPVHRSPLGLLIHPDYGLWHGYRAAILVPDAIDTVERGFQPSPCDACVMRPCLTSCPVAAFSSAGYDAASCREHLAEPHSIACWTANCLARAACPVGRTHAYDPSHAAFHMRAFAGVAGPGQRPSGPANTK